MANLKEMANGHREKDGTYLIFELAHLVGIDHLF